MQIRYFLKHMYVHKEWSSTILLNVHVDTVHRCCRMHVCSMTHCLRIHDVVEAHATELN